MTRPECLRVTESDGVAELTLDRPAERNAIDARMVAELHAVCEQLERHPRVAIISGGTDGVFAGGADIAELCERGRDDGLAGINLRLFDRLRGLPMPTIAAVDGYALGGGAELAYACDMRIATPRTAFGQPEPRLGIIAGAGATHRLVRLVGESVAKQVLLAGVQISSQRALELGLVHSVVAPARLLGPPVNSLLRCCRAPASPCE
jgi:enoyl-CoA hydratase